MTTEPIENPDDPRLDDYRNVRDPEWIRRRDIFLAEGRRIVERLLTSSRFSVRSVLVTRPALDSLCRAVGSCDVTVYPIVASPNTIPQPPSASIHSGKADSWVTPWVLTILTTAARGPTPLATSFEP